MMKCLLTGVACALRRFARPWALNTAVASVNFMKNLSFVNLGGSSHLFSKKLPDILCSS